MLAVCRVPIFDILDPILRDGIARFIDSGQGLVGGDEKILKEIFETVNGNYMTKDKVQIGGKVRFILQILLYFPLVRKRDEKQSQALITHERHVTSLKSLIPTFSCSIISS